MSPINGVYYTVETYFGHGAIDNDYTHVYLHFEHDGKSNKIEVLSGEYVEVYKIVWENPQENTIYINDGFTDIFRTRATVFTGGVSESIVSHLQNTKNPPNPAQ